MPFPSQNVGLRCRSSPSLKKSPKNCKNSTFLPRLRLPPSSSCSCSCHGTQCSPLYRTQMPVKFAVPPGTILRDIRINLHNSIKCSQYSSAARTPGEVHGCKLGKEPVVRLRRQNVSLDKLKFYQGSDVLHNSSRTPLQDPLEKDAKDLTLNCPHVNEHSLVGGHIDPEFCTSWYMDEPNPDIPEHHENSASSSISHSDRLATNRDDISTVQPEFNVLVSPLDSNRLCSNVVSQMQEADNFSPAGSLPENTVNLNNNSRVFKLFSDSISPKQLGLTHYVTVNLSKSRVLGSEFLSTPISVHSDVRMQKGSHNQKPLTGVAHDQIVNNVTESQVMDVNCSLAPAGINVKPRTRSHTNKVFSLRSRPIMFKHPKALRKNTSHKKQTTHGHINGHINVTGKHKSTRLERSHSAPHKLLCVEMHSDPKLSLKPYVELGLNNNLKRIVSVSEAQIYPVQLTEGAADKGMLIAPQSNLLINGSKKKKVSFNPFTPSKRLRLVVTNGSIDLDMASSASEESN